VGLRKIEEQIDVIRKHIDELDIEKKALKNLQNNVKSAMFETKKNLYKTLDPYDVVYLARHSERPNIHFYVNNLFTDVFEYKGDRNYSDDQSIFGAIALFEGQPVTIIGHVKASTTEDNIACNFGMPHPEGYKKAIRLAKQAEKFNRPIITFIDTPGAYPGIGAEKRGQSAAIANCILTFMELSVPVITIVTGEGGSGGALAIGCGNKILMLENSVYSVLSPEGFASILYKDASKAREAASIMKLTAIDLHNFGVIDEIIKEPLGGAHTDPHAIIEDLRLTIANNLDQLNKIEKNDIQKHRYQKFMDMGVKTYENHRNR